MVPWAYHTTFTVASRVQPTWSSVAGNTWHTPAHSLRADSAHLHRTTSPSASDTGENVVHKTRAYSYMLHITQVNIPHIQYIDSGCFSSFEMVNGFFKKPSLYFLTWYINNMCTTVSQPEYRRNSSGGGRVNLSIVCSWGKVPLDTDLPASTATSLN